ncbi:MAG: hypothetical protein U9O89_08030 [Thermoproteota archaeon]|nr:hypothetical protein [Thermoproteota archaeon]
MIPTWMLWTVALITFLILLFLLTILGLKKPKDAGPRRILEIPTVPTLTSGCRKTEGVWHSLVDIEGGEGVKLEVTTTLFIDYLEVLPNIEM